MNPAYKFNPKSGSPQTFFSLFSIICESLGLSLIGTSWKERYRRGALWRGWSFHFFQALISALFTPCPMLNSTHYPGVKGSGLHLCYDFAKTPLHLSYVRAYTSATSNCDNLHIRENQRENSWHISCGLAGASERRQRMRSSWGEAEEKVGRG